MFSYQMLNPFCKQLMKTLVADRQNRSGFYLPKYASGFRQSKRSCEVSKDENAELNDGSKVVAWVE